MKRLRTLLPFVFLTTSLVFSASSCKKRQYNQPGSDVKYGILQDRLNNTISVDLFQEGKRDINVCVVDDSIDAATPERQNIVLQAMRDAWGPWLKLVHSLPNFEGQVKLNVRLDHGCRDRFHEVLPKTQYGPSNEAEFDRDVRRRQGEQTLPTPASEVVVFIRNDGPLAATFFGDRTRSYAVSSHRMISMISRDPVVPLKFNAGDPTEFIRILSHEIGHLFGLADLYSWEGVGVLPGQNNSLMSDHDNHFSNDEYHALHAIYRSFKNRTPLECLDPYTRIHVTDADGVAESASSALFCTLKEGADGKGSRGFLVYSHLWSSVLPDPATQTTSGQSGSQNKGEIPVLDVEVFLAAAAGKRFECPYRDDKKIVVRPVADASGRSVTLFFDGVSWKEEPVTTSWPLNGDQPQVRFTTPGQEVVIGSLELDLVDTAPRLLLHTVVVYGFAKGSHSVEMDWRDTQGIFPCTQLN